MALTLGTDTYVTLADASARMDARPHNAHWALADEPAREAALRLATEILSRERYAGTITDIAQPLAWPRIGVRDSEGRAVAADTIPAAIAYATAELALALLKTDLTDDLARRSVFGSRMTMVGASMESFSAGLAPRLGLPALVREMIAPFLKDGGALSARLRP